MQANRSRDTGPEMEVRRLLHGLGLRYRVHVPVDVGGRPVRPDIVFGRQKLAVFVDGCFWHGCPQHRQQPIANSTFWREKFARNRARDERDGRRLREAGWRVLRFWEHDAREQVARAIQDELGRSSC